MKIVTLGEIMLRLSTNDNARFRQVDEFAVCYGGGEANVAVSLANYGHDAYFMSKVPSHEIGQCAVDALNKYGVHTDYVVRGGDRLGIYFLETGVDFRPSKVIYDRKNSAIAEAEITDFDYDKIIDRVSKNDIKLIEIQRSRGYALRRSITLDKIEKVIKAIRSVNKNVIIMIDNCYGEFVDKVEPLALGADVMVGSLIKNLGGGIAPNGAYIAGKKELVKLAAERLTAPGLGKEVGPTMGINKYILQGLFMAPSVVASSLKTAIFASKMLEEMGYKPVPRFNEKRSDIVQTIEFGDKEKLIKYCQGIQMGSPIDSNSIPEPWDMPGYTDQVIMAAGAFTQGSSIELSCDAPIRPPYIAFMQGGLTYEYGKLGVMRAISQIL